MTFLVLFQAIFLGIVEGVTEFLPVSSTGHLIIAGQLIGFENTVFDVVIQLGAIIAICVLYARRLFGVAFGLTSDPAARHFALAVVIAFIPSAVLGLIFHEFIRNVGYKGNAVMITHILYLQVDGNVFCFSVNRADALFAA